MYVKATTKTPKYLTKGKKYKVLDSIFLTGKMIRDDEGDKILITLKACDRLNGKDWKVYL